MWQRFVPLGQTAILGRSAPVAHSRSPGVSRRIRGGGFGADDRNRQSQRRQRQDDARDQRGRLACVDFLRPRPARPGGLRFLFDCGPFRDEQLDTITVNPAEIDEHRFAELAEAAALLSGPVRRRVLAAAAGKRCVYLEGGRRIKEVRG